VLMGATGGTTILLLSLFGSAATFMATIRFRYGARPVYRVRGGIVTCRMQHPRW
jgi:hypothetical protein